jgi:NAD(P)-dependent dehydrogenase (short-subunit alcohol dehydrogenase family)
MSNLCAGRVVIVTGGGRGIGRGEAIEFARQGAKVVVNDLGGAGDGTGADAGPAQEVVDEIKAFGGEAVANTDDVSDFDAAKRIVTQAIETYGRLDTLVNNAGVLRDRMLFNMSPDDFDIVVRVNLRGTWCMARHAAEYWREQAKQGNEVKGRMINTSSASGIYGNVGQTNYGAAKAGVAAFTVIAAKELGRYGVTVNALAPGAQSRLIDTIPDDRRMSPKPDDAPAVEWDPRHADNIAPLTVWLGSDEAADVTGRVFNVRGGHISVTEGWITGPEVDRGARWDPTELGQIVPDLVAKARANATMHGYVPEA